jgi:hypothetical protein
VPLIRSGSRAAVNSNISEMVKSGHPRAQAIAAALATARKYGGSGGAGLRRAAAAMTPPKMMKRGLATGVSPEGERPSSTSNVLFPSRFPPCNALDQSGPSGP